VVDTAPTGHTLRLLALPQTFDALIALLETMQAKHRFMVGALTRRYRRDAADDFLDEMRRTMAALQAALVDPSRAAVLLIARPEPVVAAETARYAAAVRAMGIRIAALVVNALPADADASTDAALEVLARSADGAPRFVLRWREPPPRTLQEIGDLVRGLRPASSGSGRRGGVVRSAAKGLRGGGGAGVSSARGGAPRRTPPASARPAPAQLAAAPPASIIRTLTIVAGKGGVGKTTVSCTLAIAAAARTRDTPVLLVSTDPAPSIADALGIEDPQWARNEPTPAPDVPRLFVWQMDASLAFAALRDRHRERIDALFDALVGRGLDIAHDRAILRDLLALAPPGIDELYALASLGEALDERRFAPIVVDPAPTGHLLRLLQMPALALDWTRRLMRLMLKYKDVAGLGDAARDLVAFGQRTRALESLLHDPARAGAVLVTLNEPLVRAESRRLAHALRAAGLALAGVVENRQGTTRRRSVRFDPLAPHFRAQSQRAPLVGAAALARWLDEWRTLPNAGPAAPSMEQR
jgi:arsenite-transporting ATPase